MSEAKSKATTEHMDTVWLLGGEHDGIAMCRSDSSLPANTETIAMGLSNNNGRGNGDNEHPFWMRPFFSLRAQLLFAYCMLLAIIVLTTSVLEYMHLPRVYVVVVAIAMMIVGSILSYLLTSWLLRPLGRVVDASQAIAMGDLAQRERLVLRQPPQDDIDRLAGSLDVMVSRLEFAEELQHASEQRSKQFFSDASHQLRTPLTSIRGFTEILMRGAIDDGRTRQHVLERMKNESERMSRLLNDLLTLSRLDDSRPLKLQYVDMVELANEAIIHARKRANDENTIQLDIAPHARVEAQVDKERIKQLLFILLDNAVKYGDRISGGEVTLRLNKQNNRITIQVIDNGEGIDKEDLEHIFESFYRGRPRRSTGKLPVAGAGLGLSIAHAIVSSHHGSITISSEPDKGTEVTVLLPAVE